MSLDDELNEFGRLVQKPSRGRNLYDALTEGGDTVPRDPGVGKPSNLRNISPNQFALPGMEEHAHPGARHLPKGIAFSFSSHHGEERHYDEGLSDPAEHRHTLLAHAMSPDAFVPDRHIGNALGELHWAGKDEPGRKNPHPTIETPGHYPGEITWVSRGYGEKRIPGLMSDLYKMGHDLNMGQTTVPVHSPERSSEGENWSRKVGDPAHRGPLLDFGWKPPAGIHPFERHGSPRQFKPDNNQLPLPGMEQHSAERKVDVGDVLKNWIR